MQRRLLVYSPLAIWQPPIYETQLEIIQNYLDDGYKVTVLTCAATLPTCEANPEHRRAVCRLCRSRSHSGVKWLQHGDVEVIDFLCVTAAQSAMCERFSRTSIASIAQLRSLQLEGSDIGMAVLSSLVSLLREPAPDVNLHAEGIRTGLRAAALVHFSIRNHIERLGPETLLLFNGRIGSLRPALRVGQAMGIRTLVYEVGGAPDRYLMTVNTYPHDLAALKDLFNGTFDNASETIEEKTAIAESWYQARIANRPHDGLAFSGGQEVGRLPDELTSTGLRVGVFISSDDEFVAIDGWDPPVYQNQVEGLRRILGAFSGRDDIQFVLRVHPHLRGIDNSQTRELDQIAREFPALHLIRADSTVHTYSLVEAVDIVLTFGSTVAIEAVYLGTPSLLLGRHIFEDMGGVIRPDSHEDLVRILSDAASGSVQKLPDDSRDAVVRFGFAQSRFGIPYRFVRRTSPNTAVLLRDGHESRLAPSLMARIVTVPVRGLRYAQRRARSLFARSGALQRTHA